MKKVLLVEDDPFLIDIYSTKLGESGFEVHLAKDGGAVLDFSKKIKPDIIILDIVLPHIDGWQILKQLRVEEGLKHTKIIILSNLSQKEEVEKGLSLGADKYLIKSDYTPTQVIDEINKVSH
ncbi:response regulator [Patescibacteria group bacterium]|nr:response regulator [Patescibacteria group bacterium]MBU4162255.1 response regulator [Patescibacteria group bacterium]